MGIETRSSESGERAASVIRTFLNYFLEKDLESADAEAEERGLPKPAEE